jgi:RimJ/RimL family protein N-acetyltransferase
MPAPYLVFRRRISSNLPGIKHAYYISQSANEPSIALAKACGFEFAGLAEREPLGVFGRIKLTENRGEFG